MQRVWVKDVTMNSQSIYGKLASIINGDTAKFVAGPSGPDKQATLAENSDKNFYAHKILTNAWNFPVMFDCESAKLAIERNVYLRKSL